MTDEYEPEVRNSFLTRRKQMRKPINKWWWMLAACEVPFVLFIYFHMMSGVAKVIRHLLLVTLGVFGLCSIGHADFIRADVNDPDTQYQSFRGDFTAVYDSTDVFTATNVYFVVDGDHNWGIVARDSSPIGWIDAQAEQWDLTIDGIGYMGLSGGGGVPGLQLIEDGVRLVNDGTESYVTYIDPSPQGQSETYRVDVNWDNIAVAVPEPAAAVLAVLAALLLALSLRISHEATRKN